MPPIPVKRGALPTPQKLIDATPSYVPDTGEVPAETALMRPPRISTWGNERYADCVTAEEAFAKACHSPSIFITDAEAIRLAQGHDTLNGATCYNVLQWMLVDGFVQGPNMYCNGPFTKVDWTVRRTLQGAILVGPVKLAIAADQLEKTYLSDPGDGWFAHGYTAQAPIDHCVSLCGYGTASWLAQQFGVPVPDGVSGDAFCYAMFTWNSIGIIDESSLLAITGEAWLRNPTTTATRPNFPPAGANPVLIQSSYGDKQHGNFELVVGGALKGLFHAWRNDAVATMPWSSATTIEANLPFEGVTMIESNYGKSKDHPGHLEVIGRVGTELWYAWRAKHWIGPSRLPFDSGDLGNPVLIQSKTSGSGDHRNFELIASAPDQGMLHFWRDNADSRMPWHGPTHFGTSLGRVEAATMIESSYKHLEVICRVGPQLYYCWRSDQLVWSSPELLALKDGAAGNPVLVQRANDGGVGDFILMIPGSIRGVHFYSRINTVPHMPWAFVGTFAESLGRVDAITMIESNYGTYYKHLEVICRVGRQLFFCWYDGTSWSSPQLLVTSQ